MTSDRDTICMSQPVPDLVLHHGDESFATELEKSYTRHESLLLQNMITLKNQLRDIDDNDTFWSHVAEKMAHMVGAQLSFVSKRILVDEQDAPVEMPPIGEPGACLMASALHYNDGKGTQNSHNSFKYHAYGCPCGYMRHDKVFLVPDSLNTFSPDNPNELPFTCESYLGIPLFSHGKCFAHFGVMWSADGMAKRKLSWANVELALHCLEDVILNRLLQGTTFTETKPTPAKTRNRVIPHDAVTIAQSLKPYARSLSHELRTPMQGVVGMLDVMYVTVQEAFENQTNDESRKVFETLKENIEIVQDSSRRAVEAADNVVHAYDMDMHVPVAADPNLISAPETQSAQPDILVAGSNLPLKRPNKRRRRTSSNDPRAPTGAHINGDLATLNVTRKAAARSISPQSRLRQVDTNAASPDIPTPFASMQDPFDSARMLDLSIAPGLRHAQLRIVLQNVINEGLKVGGRPDSAIARETVNGEIIDVVSRDAAGQLSQRHVEWSIDADVPSTLLVDEKDLRKLISCVFLNAIKFTTAGSVIVRARMSTRMRHVVISVTDTGPGIDESFLPNLFKPFSQEDPSLTRQSEGLGLGLLVAKGVARKLGGDLLCARSHTQGPKRGSVFEMRIPLSAADQLSRSSSPFNTPSARPTRQNTLSADVFTSASASAPITTPTPQPGDKGQDTAPRSTRADSSAVQSHLARAGSERNNGHPTVLASPTPARVRPPLAPRKPSKTMTDIDRNLAQKYPLTFLVAEDNHINRRLLVNMLKKFGYTTIHEAFDGAEAVRQIEKHGPVDVILMDIWMPMMDGYEATEKIMNMSLPANGAAGNSGTGTNLKSTSRKPTVLAVTADVTDGALKRAANAGMVGFMSKPFRILDLQRLLLEYCALPTTAKMDADAPVTTRIDSHSAEVVN